MFYVRPETAKQLRPFLATKILAEPFLRMSCSSDVADMSRVDLEDAEVIDSFPDMGMTEADAVRATRADGPVRNGRYKSVEGVLLGVTGAIKEDYGRLPS